jgi:adenosylcobinamide kinase/adenosylcobinamide-phosphate guanylyltransferase
MNPFAPAYSHIDAPPTGGASQLILGGARSGKSALAERRALAAEAAGYEVLYLATAQPADSAADPEMVERIRRHQQRRPAHWGLLEEPLQLAATLQAHAAPQRLILVDCLTLWLSNLLFSGAAGRQAEAGETVDCPLLSGAIGELCATLPTLPGQILLVSNEVGWGVVPANPLARLFADEQGRLNQRVAAVCERVTLVAAGLPLELKPSVCGQTG